MTMKLYITATGRYVGTQQEAKADGKGWVPEEVPTDKPGLIHYLNTLTLGAKPTLITEIVAAPSHMSTSVIEQSAIGGITQLQVEEYILNEASVAQVSELFARLGTRFKELAALS
jgi:hypothetical protein